MKHELLINASTTTAISMMPLKLIKSQVFHYRGTLILVVVLLYHWKYNFGTTTNSLIKPPFPKELKKN